MISAAWRYLPSLATALVLALLLAVAGPADALDSARVVVTHEDGARTEIQRYPAQGAYLIVWLPSAEGEARRQARQAARVAEAGIEVWIPQLLATRFLPRVGSSLEAVPAQDVADVIQVARARSGRRVAVLAAGRAALPALTGASQWRMQADRPAGLLGAVLVSPYIYAGSPSPGRQPSRHEQISGLDLSVVLLQPELSPRYWWRDLAQRYLREAGARIVETRVLADVRDGFYRRPQPRKQEREMIRRLPELLRSSLEALAG